MDNLYVQTFFFAVPFRIIWDNWEKFCGEQINPNDSTDYSTPQIQGVTFKYKTARPMPTYSVPALLSHF